MASIDEPAPSKRLRLTPNVHSSVQLESALSQETNCFSRPTKDEPILATATVDERDNSDSGFTDLASSSLSSSNNDKPPAATAVRLDINPVPSTSAGPPGLILNPKPGTSRECFGPSLPPPPPHSCSPDEDFEDDSEDDMDSDSSSVSRLSGLSNLSDTEMTFAGSLNPWIRRQIIAGVSPRALLAKLIETSENIPPNISDMTLWRIIANTVVTPRRRKLREIHSLDHALELVRAARNIIVLTGAGVSVSCGIPDFRSRDGIYSRLSKEYPDLPDPQAMFDIRYFYQDPRPFFKFAREIYPGQFAPSPSHRFIKRLEEKGKLLRNYSQNIDTLEQIAGIGRVIECHGSFATASCTRCKIKVTADAIKEDVFHQRIPICRACNPDASSPSSAALTANDEATKLLVERGIMKPDIVFFGEGLPEVFHDTIETDRERCDLLIVIGSSLKVRPVAMIPNWIPPHVPQILINREPLYHMEFDVNLLGDSDIIVNQLCMMLGEDWESLCWNKMALRQCETLLPVTETAAAVAPAPEPSNKPPEAPTPPPPPSHVSYIAPPKPSPSAESVSSSSDSVHIPPIADRHLSVDSAKDSGISEAATPSGPLLLSDNSNASPAHQPPSTTMDDFDGCITANNSETGDKNWCEKRVSISERLPPHSYYKLASRVYVFGGAEIFYSDLDEDEGGEETTSDEESNVTTTREDVMYREVKSAEPGCATPAPIAPSKTTTTTDQP